MALGPSRLITLERSSTMTPLRRSASTALRSGEQRLIVLQTDAAMAASLSRETPFSPLRYGKIVSMCSIRSVGELSAKTSSVASNATSFFPAVSLSSSTRSSSNERISSMRAETILVQCACAASWRFFRAAAPPLFWPSPKPKSSSFTSLARVSDLPLEQPTTSTICELAVARRCSDADMAFLLRRRVGLVLPSPSSSAESSTLAVSNQRAWKVSWIKSRTPSSSLGSAARCNMTEHAAARPEKEGAVSIRSRKILTALLRTLTPSSCSLSSRRG
mmetsp:Transcript_6727/g.16056  ORF Transcript_6727/g.16056 Transcript_6727/m.16056 type:complete len:275 (-) Transcript_6727:652-1476(-)